MAEHLSGTDTVKNLLDQIKFVKKVMVSDPVVPILENLLFSNGILYGSCLQASAMHKTKFKGDFSLSCSDITKFLTKIKDKQAQVTISYDNETYAVMVSCGKFKTKFAGDNHGDFPKILVPKKEIGKFGADAIKKLKMAGNFTSNDQLRPAMTGILISEKCELAATDGHRLYFSKFEEKHKMPGSFILSESVKNFIKTEFKDGFIMKYATEKVEVIEIEGQAKKDSYTNPIRTVVSLVSLNEECAVVCNCIDEAFPDYKNVVPSEAMNVIKVNRKALTEAIDMALLTANSYTKQVRIGSEKESTQLIITSEDLDFSKETRCEVDAEFVNGRVWNRRVFADKEDKVGKIQPTSEMILIGFNGSFMMTTLNDIEEEEIEIKLVAANKAIVINNTALVMPVMLNQYV